ncbi:MAG: hypothetical protein FJ117_10085 [Deltaproteobacteria bacterium]|nr:hypothetical protein [Deltaproteobacteria bacterium]
MMAIFSSSIGIDFRRDHLILTLLRRYFGKVHLVDYRIHRLGIESPKEFQQTQWINPITAFISQHQIDKEKVFISIPREKVIVRFLRLPLATKENLRKVIEYEAPKYIPFDREEICFDYQILREEKDSLFVIAVFTRKEEVLFYLSLLKKMGIQPQSVQISSTAALNLFFYNERGRDNELAILLDLHEPFYEANLIQGKEWQESFYLPLPPERKEEKIINTFQRAGIKSDQLARSSFFIYGMDTVEKALPVFGKSSAINIKKVFRPPLDRLQVRKRETKPEHIYASIGVSLKGLTETSLDLNLLPVEMRKKVRQIGKPLFVIFLTLTVVLSFSLGLGVYGRYRDELDTLRAEVIKRKPEVEAVEKLRKQKEEVAKEISELEKIRSGEVSKVEILKELTQILPASVWIWNLKQSGKEIEISGFADSASDLIPLIDKSPLFEKVEFLAPVTKERERRAGGEKEKERFKIKMRLEGRRAVP